MVIINFVLEAVSTYVPGASTIVSAIRNPFYLIKNPAA